MKNITLGRVVVLLSFLLPACHPLAVYHLDPNPNTPKRTRSSPSMTIARDPIGKLPPQFSLCASFYQSLRTRATGQNSLVSHVRVFSEFNIY